jgi:hypothetical protein
MKNRAFDRNLACFLPKTGQNPAFREAKAHPRFRLSKQTANSS